MFAHTDSDEIADVIGQMHGIANASMRVLLAGIVEIDQRDAWKVDAASSMAAWLEMRHGVGHATAREWVRTARALVFTPHLAASFDAGHLSWDQLVAAIDLVAFGGLDQEAVALDAVGRSAAELDRLAAEARRVSREQGEARRTNERLRGRWSKDGMYEVHGRFADARGKVVENALRREAENVGEDPTDTLRPYEQKMADALFGLASAGIARDADPDRATIVLHLDAHAMASDPGALDLARLELGPLVSLATAHRLACDGRCQVVVDDLLGRTVEVAKTVHAVPRWLRRRILDRDGQCRWPGCGRTSLLHAHHIVFWGRGGLTEESNLVALCWFHHHAVHEGGWTIEGDPQGRLTFSSPRGRTLKIGPPPLRDDVRDHLGLRWCGDPPARAA